MKEQRRAVQPCRRVPCFGSRPPPTRPCNTNWSSSFSYARAMLPRQTPRFLLICPAHRVASAYRPTGRRCRCPVAIRRSARCSALRPRRGQAVRSIRRPRRPAIIRLRPVRLVHHGRWPIRLSWRSGIQQAHRRRRKHFQMNLTQVRSF